MSEASNEGFQAARRAATIGRWLRQGWRAVFLLRPDWRGLRGTPWGLLLAFAASLVVTLGAMRAAIVGPASIYWPALGTSVVVAAILAWACWFVMPANDEYRDPRRHPPDAATLLTLLYVMATLVNVLTFAALLPAMRSDFFDEASGNWLVLALGMLPSAWSAAAMMCLMMRSRASAPGRRWLACGLVVVGIVGVIDFIPGQFWYATSQSYRDTRLDLTQETMELQPRLLSSALQSIEAQRPGVTDLYAITFAPYASEDVFMRESALVSDVMATRFDAAGRTLQLVNNKATVTTLPWATPLNLQRAIARFAERMDKQDDILFIHLTSHGGADGRLAASARPMTVDSVTPQDLRKWLDAAGIRHRVISISACFSGSWIAPLANDDTLVMTAADADHTSYGCGSKSTLTFFGQAMYDEQLRHTWSFEEAHAASRKLIDERERAAGKSDGYSNPQISVGVGIREKLKALEGRLAASATK